MKNVVFLLLVVFAGYLSGCRAQDKKTETTDPTEGAAFVFEKLSPDAFVKKYEEMPDGQLIDVRTPPEVAQGHIKGAGNIDFRAEDFKAKASAELDKEKPVFIYCRSGKRSGAASEVLKELGFATIYDMEGGFLRWAAEEKPVEK